MWYVELAIQVVVIYLVLMILVLIQLALIDDWPSQVQEVDPLTIHTGDLLGVSYRNPFGWFVTAFTSSVWSHTGIAWRCPQTNELFIFESAQYSKKYVGVFRIPFDLWLRINRNHELCHLQLQGTIDPYKMDDICRQLEQISLDTLNWEWYRFFMRRPYMEETLKSHYTCYEITIICLQRLGVVKKEFTPSSYFPRDIIWRHLPMEPGFSYSDPIQLTVRRIPI